MVEKHRMSRVDSEIQKVLANIISKLDDAEISDSIISILKVETFSDFSLSKVFVSVLGDEEKKFKIVSKLNSLKKQIRFNLAHSLKFRNVPDLLFVVDETEEHTEKMMKLFEQIEHELPKSDGEDVND